MNATVRKHPPRRRPDVTRDAIVAAAFEEIHRHGFQAASLANILAKTGLTKGALYHHFPTKNDLGHAVIDEVIRDALDTQIFAPLRDSADPYATLLETVARKAGKASLGSVALGCPLNNLIQEMSPLDAEFKKRLNAVLTAWQEAVSDALRRAQKQGRVRRDLNVRAAALFIVSAFEGCIGIAKNMQTVKEFRLCIRQLLDYIESLSARRR